ncbi:hypothetical protein GX408_01540 [bacterium]|nr:hypothetical protein [bacterium]
MKSVSLSMAVLCLTAGCSRPLVFYANEVLIDQTVSVRLTSGQSVTGEVVSKEAGALVIKDRDGQSWKAQTNAIQEISGPPPVLDAAGAVIPERVIQAHKNSKNALLFSVSGGILSLGTSFFLSSMASRALGDDDRDAVLYGGTATGTAAGVLLFSRIGSKKDRQHAIQQIRRERAVAQGQRDLNGEVKKREHVQTELEKLRQERAAQDAEIRRLQEKIQDKQKK